MIKQTLTLNLDKSKMALPFYIQLCVVCYYICVRVASLLW